VKRTPALNEGRSEGSDEDPSLDALRRTAAAGLPRTGEQLLPWLGAASLVGLVTLGALSLGDGEASSVQNGTLLLVLFATVVVAGLVAVRSRTANEATEREERARPAREQLVNLDAPDTEQPATRSYFEGVERWTVALRELFDHASDTTTDDEIRAELVSASDDAEALHDLLATTTGRELNLNEAATLHSICTLWETDQDRLEQLAADVDPMWHRRWRGRSVVERLLRHGPPQRGELVLPYRRS
jgi:hypothetical protein